MINKDDLKVMDPEGVVDDPKHLQLSAQGQALARFMAAILMRHYPDWRWAITVDEKGGVCHIFCMDLSGEMGYTMYLDALWNGGNFDYKLVLMGGGEILERYGLPAKGKTDDWMSYVTFAPGGEPIPDITDKTRGLRKHLLRRVIAGNAENDPQKDVSVPTILRSN